MILLIDNYDSFVYNLARYLRELGEEVDVVRNDAMDPEAAIRTGSSHLVVSPGPCTPSEAGESNAIIGRLAGEIPILGVCLGHQCIGAVWGARVVRARRPMHGKISSVHHDGSDLFEGIPTPFAATRYHSLVLDRGSLPPDFDVTAWTDDDEIMAVRHRSLPVWGVQFHPEAVLTEHGHVLLNNFLALGRGEAPPGRGDDLPLRELALAQGGERRDSAG
ncbi:MAG: anthranilate synthase component II [Gemmatimonadota bacterium]